MLVVESFADFDAPPETVWDVLTEFAAYPEWNPVLVRVEGEPEDGERLRVRVEPSDTWGFTFWPVLTEVDPGRRLAWRGRLLVPFALDGYHEFHLEPLDGDRTRLLQRETFRGALILALVDEESVEAAFDEMHEALAERLDELETERP